MYAERAETGFSSLFLRPVAFYTSSKMGYSRIAPFVKKLAQAGFVLNRVLNNTGTKEAKLVKLWISLLIKSQGLN